MPRSLPRRPHAGNSSRGTKFVGRMQHTMPLCGAPASGPSSSRKAPRGQQLGADTRTWPGLRSHAAASSGADSGSGSWLVPLSLRTDPSTLQRQQTQRWQRCQWQLRMVEAPRRRRQIYVPYRAILAALCPWQPAWRLWRAPSRQRAPFCPTTLPRKQRR